MTAEDLSGEELAVEHHLDDDLGAQEEEEQKLWSSRCFQNHHFN